MAALRWTSETAMGAIRAMPKHVLAVVFEFVIGDSQAAVCDPVVAKRGLDQSKDVFEPERKN